MNRFFILTLLLSAVSCGHSKGLDPDDNKPDGGETVVDTYASGVQIRGGDISELTYVEKKGGVYYQDGKARDCLDILQDAGINTVRLRLYNDPGNPDYEPSKRLPSGIQDEADILNLAKRAKAHGMKIVLSFHYSDYWTNGETQTVPHEWAEKQNVTDLGQRVYDFTYAFLKKMEAQGTSPEYVSLGNEIQAGILYPVGSCNNMTSLCALLQKGSEAVRAAAPGAKVILHLDGAGDTDKYTWFFGAMNDGKVDYDIIGASYYPYWTGRTCTQVCTWANSLYQKFSKPILLMETGYAWTQKLPDGANGQLSHNKPYTDMSPAGQKAFMIELNREISTSVSKKVLGYLYWDPIFIEAGDAGWELGGNNVVSNSTFFDYKGAALPVLEAFK